MKYLACLVLMAACVTTSATASVQLRGAEIMVLTPRYAATLSSANGALLSLAESGKTGTICRSGEQGLWQARFLDGTTLDASAFAPTGERLCVTKVEGDTVTLTYTAPELLATIHLTATPQALELRSAITPRLKTLLEFALPGRLRFEPANLQRFLAPMASGSSVGIACNGRFFGPQPQDQPSGWRSEQAQAQRSYEALYGGTLEMRPDRDPATKLVVTTEGRQWLGENLAERLTGLATVVNRPPKPGQADLTLLDSPNGPYFSASHLGGSGYLWRLGGGVDKDMAPRALEMVGAVIDRLVQQAPPGRTRVGLVALRRGPEQGGWADVAVSDWRARLARAARLGGGKLQFVALPTPEAMLAAAHSDEYLVLLNPYGESAPVGEGGMPATIEAVGKFVRGGGNWFEVGGHPFYYAMRPLRFLQVSLGYPPAFADFYRLETTGGVAALYRMQPQNLTPWIGAQKPETIFIPGRMAFGGDEQGGYCDRAFATYLAAGTTWQPPAVRLACGNSVAADLAAYAEANGLSRKLPDKVDPATLAKLKQGVMVFLSGTAQEKTKALPLLPQPTLIHWSDYLQGGFDKQYPDHLPPNQWFGTPEELKQLLAQAKQAGHLTMPYTNPTWWCDHPRGPTFAREGEAPLAKNLEGKLYYERYAQNDGWTVCHWHPAVQAANRRTVKEFSTEFPVDVLFQDQCGARGWVYDTNPAAPTVYAYSEGLQAMCAEDCRVKPLSTECGWDRVVNFETQLCGMTWGIVPTENGPQWARHLTNDYPAETWTVFPLAQYLAHDKTMMLHHDLGQFVTNRPMLTWSLGLGFSLSYRTSPGELTRESRRQWLLWLDRLQKSVCARYLGEPITAFEHLRAGGGDEQAGGTLRAVYGPVSLLSNLGPTPVATGGKSLAPFGFYATAPGVVAGNLQTVGGVDAGPEGVCFVTEGSAKSGDVWLYAPPQQVVTIPAPENMNGPVRLTLDGQTPAQAVVKQGMLTLTTPGREGVRRLTPPAALAGKAPKAWPGARPAVGVIALGPGLGLSWTKITPDTWVSFLEQSPLAKSGVAVKRLGTYDELQTALTAGPTQWLAIINPYGESFPIPGPGRAREALAALRDYVSKGGVWWETGGYSLYRGVYRTAAGWGGDPVGPGGMGQLGVPVGGGEVDAPAQSLTVTPQGRQWFSADLVAKLNQSDGIVNRANPRGSDDPGHLTLVAGDDQDYLAGYRLDGWGWLWRAGGMNPEEGVLLPVVAQTLEHIYNNPPAPVGGGNTYFLWHAKLQAQ